MQFLDILEGTQSKAKVLKAIAYIDKSPVKFGNFMAEFMNAGPRESQKLAWIIGKIADTSPNLIGPHVKTLINKMNEPCHAAVKRNVLRAIDKSGIPSSEMGRLADLAFTLLADLDETVAVRVFSMSILHKICLLESDLALELVPLLEYQMPHEGAGFRSRANKIIKSLSV